MEDGLYLRLWEFRFNSTLLRTKIVHFNNLWIKIPMFRSRMFLNIFSVMGFVLTVAALVPRRHVTKVLRMSCTSFLTIKSFVAIRIRTRVRSLFYRTQQCPYWLQTGVNASVSGDTQFNNNRLRIFMFSNAMSSNVV